MNQELLSFVIETMLMKPRPQVGVMGCATADTSQPAIYDVVRENADVMRDLIVERLAGSIDAIADAVMEIIKLNARIEPEVMFELCDEVVTSYVPVLTNRVTSVDPKLAGSLGAMLTYCNYSFAPPVVDLSNNPSMMHDGRYKDALMSCVGQLHGIASGLKTNVETFIQAMLSSKVYSPFTLLHECNSKVVIIHDGPDRDKLESIADKKNMVILPATTENDPIRPELVLLLMINAYNSSAVNNSHLFPKGDRVHHKWDEDGHHQWVEHANYNWTNADNYLIVDKYIYATCGMLGELTNKVPGFLEDFDKTLTAIRNELDQ